MRVSTKLLIELLTASLALSLLSGCAGPTERNVVVVKKSGLPVVYYRVMIDAGSAYDPADKPGLAYFTAQMLDKGTKTFSRTDIESELDRIGAELTVQVDKEVVTISGRTLADKAGVFYSVFREILTAPIFSEDEVSRQKTEQLDQIRRVREDDAALSLAVFENALYAGHRYGHLIVGTESAVSSFTRDDVVNFFKKYYLRGNVYAGIAGAVDDSLVERFQSDLKRLPAGRVVRSDVVPRNPRHRRVILVEKENRTQSHLRLGHHLNVSRSSADYYPLRLLGCYLGQHREMFGRLFRTVREERGLAYGAYAYTEYFRPAGWSKQPANGICRANQYFHMWTYPKEINFEFCIKLMLDELTKLSTAPIAAEEVDRVKNYVANNLAFQLETPQQHLGMLLDQMWYDTPDFIERFRERIASVPRTELQTAALNHLLPRNLLIVAVVSDGAAARTELLTNATKLELPSGSKEGDLKAENERIRAIALDLKPEDIEIVRAEEVWR